ncbi:uncharacterized protein LOC127122994 [Lathyrus oleraceus]|uniref:uncharacterized protein LOC127122994 n=1 Tax=Pisum sativum TaxID=3888 RepID=UPI0021D25E72|nr:uncharacterized protein LOC127122994 [Pisum sativum]
MDTVYLTILVVVERDADEFRALGKFQRNNPPTFEGTHEPDKAQELLKAIEKIFRVTNCSDAQKVQFGTHMLEKEAKDWWRNTVQRFDENGIEQGNGTVAEYAAKFEELIKFCPHYNTANAERSKCVKFVNGLRPDIKKAMGCQQITRFLELVNKSKIYDEDSRESAAHYKSLHDKKGKWKFQGKLYDCKKKAGDGKKPSWGGSHTPVKCFRCGVEGHRSPECPKGDVTCFKCGKQGHKFFDCRVGSNVTCYNCGEQGHINSKCNKPKKEQAEEGASQRRLNLKLSVMHGSMVTDTPPMGSVTTSSVCLKCSLNICDKDFEVDLVCLTLSELDVILGMDWLRANHVYINFFAKAVLFLEPEKEGDVFLSTQQVNESVRDGAEVFMLVASLKLSENGTMGEFPVVRDFPEVFPDEVSDLPSEREVEFTIDLIPGTSPVLMAAYRMSPSELKELKSQLEDLLDKSVMNAPDSEEDRAAHLRIVLSVLKEKQLFAKISKCEFWLKEVSFLGHVISSGGISVVPSNIKAISQWEASKSVSEIRSFLGLFTRKGQAFIWTAQCEASFQELERRLTTAPVLILPNPSESFVVYCDASLMGLGECRINKL